MKSRSGIRFMIALLVATLVIGIAGSPVIAARAKESAGAERRRVASVSNVVRRHRKRTFKLTNRSCESGCIETYKSSDGQEVTAILACYSGSAKDARRDMQTLIDEGRVIKRGWRRNWRRTWGERFVVRYPKDETGEKPAKIFRHTRGDICFSYIEAGSLALALEFERSDPGKEAMYGIEAR